MLYVETEHEEIHFTQPHGWCKLLIFMHLSNKECGIILSTATNYILEQNISNSYTQSIWLGMVA